MAQMNAEEKRAFRQMLNAAKNLIVADGKVDYDETTMLFGLVEPLAKIDPDCDALLKALVDIRADGVVSPEEASRLVNLIGVLSRKDSGLVYGIEERPPFFAALFAAFQHLLAIFVAIITPPLLIASGLQIDDLKTKGFLVSMALFASGVCTFIQCKRLGPVGSRLLCVQGTSFQFIGPLIGVGMVAQSQASSPEDVVWGLPLIFGCCICAAPAEMAAAFLFKKLRTVITPLVSGIVVALIGLGLIKVGIISCGGGFGSMAPDAKFPFAGWQNLTVSGAVLLTIVGFNCARNKYLRMGSVVFGILVGYLIAFFGFHMVSFETGTLLSFNIPQPFKWGVRFDPTAILGLAIVYVVTSIEASGDITANSMISGLSIDDESYHRRVRGGVLADGVNSAVAGVFNSFPNSIFAQNNGLIQLTGVASRYVGYFIAAMLLLLGLFPVVGMLFSTMPDPVLGGATLLMFGMVAAAGIRIIASQPIGRKETLVLALSFGAGLGVELCPDILSHAPTAVKGIFGSGLVTGGLVAIVSNAILRIKE